MAEHAVQPYNEYLLCGAFEWFAMDNEYPTSHLKTSVYTKLENSNANWDIP